MMHQILDFMRAAAPWAAIGSLLVILAVRGAAEKRKAKGGKATTVWRVCVWECVSECASARHWGTTLS